MAEFLRHRDRNEADVFLVRQKDLSVVLWIIELFGGSNHIALERHAPDLVHLSDQNQLVPNYVESVHVRKLPDTDCLPQFDVAFTKALKLTVLHLEVEDGLAQNS